MRVRSLSLASCLATTVTLAACATARPTEARAAAPVHYRVEIPDPSSQYFEVEARVPSRQNHTDLALPAWTPGSYLIRDFGKHVYDLQAEGEDGSTLVVEARDKHTWRVRNGRKPFVVHYRVFAAERSVRTSHIDNTHASINGASVFVFEPGHTDRAREVEIVAPSGWRSHSALARRGNVFSAPDYDTLVDGPIELGTPEIFHFDVGDTAFEYVLSGASEAPVDAQRLVDDAKTIATTLGEMMGGLPMRRYVFFMQVTQDGGGGLEHATSTVMMMRRASFDRDDAYDRASRLTAHEFFHLWNVKRIHDRVLGPFDYLHENYSRLLWFHEGFTETIESQAMLRSGIWSQQDYLDHVAKRFTAYSRKPGRNAMPLSEISMRAWTHAYQPAPNHPNVTISYYEKGDIVGIALDLEIRTRSGGKGSLAGVFRRLMRDFAAQGKGIESADIVAAASAEAGEDLSDFFKRYVEGTEPVPLPLLLRNAGLEVTMRSPWTNAQGEPIANADRKRAWIGVQLRGNVIRNRVPATPASDAGLMRGDEIVAVQGRRTDAEAEVRRELGRAGVGSTIELSVFRDDQLMTLPITVQENPHRIMTLRTPKDPSAATKAWLGLPPSPSN